MEFNEARNTAAISALEARISQLERVLNFYIPMTIEADVPLGEDGAIVSKNLGILGFLMGDGSGGGGGGGGIEGAFYTMRTSSEEATLGNIYLQGGMVTAGTGNKTVADILLFTAPTPPAEEGEWEGTPGQILILVVDGNGQETSGILDPVFNTTTGVLASTIGASPAPANNLPEHGLLAGTCILMLGTFYEGGFSPSTPGNFQINFCWGGFNVTRI